MTVKDLFTDGPLKGFKAVCSDKLNSVKGMKVGVDLSIFLYVWCKLDEYAIPATSVPRYDSQVLEEQIKSFDTQLKQIFPLVVYVYEGKDLPLKKEVKIERQNKVLASKQKLDNLLDKHNNGHNITNDELNEIKKLRRGISAPDEVAYGKAIQYMKSNNMIVFGAPGEAEHQLVKLQQQKLIDTILTRDADLIPLNASHIIYDLKFNYSDVGQSKIVIYKRDTIISNTSTFQEISTCQTYLQEYATLLGTDYSRRVPFVGPSKIKPFMQKYITCNSDDERNVMLLELEAIAVVQGRIRYVDQPRKDYISSTDRQSFINSLDATNITKIDKSFIGWANNFTNAVSMFRYCPVFELVGSDINLSDSSSFEVSLVPLNDLPHGSTWSSLLGFDPVTLLNLDNATNAKKVCTLQSLLRFDGRAPSLIQTPTYSTEENETVATTEPLPRYARLDFTACPIKLQPTEVLISWLDARGVHVLSDDRGEIEFCVRESIRVEKVVLEPELQPKDNPFHWFDVVQPSPRGDKFDQWCGDWTELLPQLQCIDDKQFDRIFGKGANGIRERARGLVFDGNIMMNGIECINVTSRNDNDTTKLMLFRTRVCPSMKTTESKSKKHLFYHVHACAEIGDDDSPGLFRSVPFTSCSCEAGKFFCSHTEALIIGIAMAQSYSKQGRLDELMAYFKAKEDPRLSQGKPILFENYTLRATSEQATAKRKRDESDEKTPSRKRRVSPRRKVTP